MFIVGFCIKFGDNKVQLMLRKVHYLWLAHIVKILNIYVMLSCTQLYHFFPVSIQYLQCIHCLLHQTLEIFNRNQPEVKSSGNPVTFYKLAL